MTKIKSSIKQHTLLPTKSEEEPGTKDIKPHKAKTYFKIFVAFYGIYLDIFPGLRMMRKVENCSTSTVQAEYQSRAEEQARRATST